ITMDPKLLDVNVHPSKVEVKLSKERELLELVENTVRRALLDLNLIPEVGHQSKEKQKVEQETLDFNDYKKKRLEKRPVSMNNHRESLSLKIEKMTTNKK